MKTPSFRTKLWLYFVLFAAVIFSLLWILQTVGLQSFYDGMMKNNIRSAAKIMAAAAESDDFFDIIDRLSFEDSLLVYITDTEGNVYYSSDAFKPFFHQTGRPGPGGRRNDPFRKNDPNGFPPGALRNLPDNYGVFLEKLAGSENGTVEYTENNTFICGARITLDEEADDDDDDEIHEAVLYVSGTLGAVGAAASIIRAQLLWVTVLSLIIGFVIAWLIARRFAAPINQLTEQAKMLAGDHYEEKFQKGFCRELDDLNDSLTESAEKLSEARSYQKELLANVSHDLRTPLTMIKGYAEMVRDISWEDEEQRNADTGVIIKEADRMTALVNEILEYSRLQEANRDLHFTRTDLSALTENVTDRFETLFRNEGGVIERNITPGCIVEGDADMLERVIFNLIDNAVRHSEAPDMRISVSVYKDDRVHLEVTDHGRGIAPDDLPHIWEKYYTTRQRGGKGVSGLGLSIVKQIAALHHADLSVTSEIGEGSTFGFHIAEATE